MAGVAAAALPIIVHLLNRRRFQVVEWGAMDFLLEAVARSRRIFELRDVLLMLLRLACLLLFGLALARPYWSRSAQAAADPNRPVHAVILVDNSLSTSYQRLGGSVLEECKKKAREVIADLPRGSMVTVIPVCGSAAGASAEAHSSIDAALETLNAIKPVDRAARAASTVDLAAEACRRNTKLANKRIVLIADQQVEGWSADSESEQLKQLPAPVQVIEVAAGEVSNAWVADVQLRDGVADTESPSVVVATVGYQGAQPRDNVQATLKIDGQAVTSQTISLQPKQSKEVQFPEYRFAAQAEQGRAGYSTVEVSLPADELVGDDARSIVVPVVASLPVVFVDAIGDLEDPAQGVYGDTFWLRRLLAPQLEQQGQQQSLIQVRRLQLDQVTREALDDVRLVVIAGVQAPTAEVVGVLAEYVEQGGNLIVAGGGGFDPAVWNEVAWKEGRGILPAALEPQTLGRPREDRAGQAEPFVLDFDSLVNEYFRPEGVGEEELRGLYGPPTLFFRTLVPVCDAAVEAASAAAAAEYFGGQREAAAGLEKKLTDIDSAGRGAAAADEVLQQRAEVLRKLEEIQPSWLSWARQARRVGEERRSVESLSRRARPAVLARLNNGTPLLVRRYWGSGVVLFLSTSLSPQWTTLPDVGQSWWLMDRIVRSLLTDTLPVRNASTEAGFVLPVAANERSARYTLTGPDGEPQPLTVDALGADQYGINLGNWTQRGIYRITAAKGDDAGAAEEKLWELPLAVNGPADESELQPSKLGKSAAGPRSFMDVAAAGAGTTRVAKEDVDIWKWLLGLVLAMLLVELFVAAKSTPNVRPEVAA
jgi:hypothetical protein